MDRQPVKGLKKLKRGDVREDGFVFWGYHATAKNGEYWISRDKYDKKVEASREISRRSYRKNREKILPKMRAYAKDWYCNKGGREYNKNYQKSDKYREYRRSNKNLQIGLNLRTRIRQSLKGVAKCDSHNSLLGCTPNELRKHLEAQFRDGMSWDNYGYYGWHIDHIRPCSSFDLSLESEQRKCFHFTNLQPLWANENYAKGAKTK